MHNVFVYGTLKAGEPNESCMQTGNGKMRFIGPGQTKTLFPLVIASKFNIPMILRDRGNGYQIKGEVYEVDDKKLEQLDILEAYPELYTREIEEIQMTNGSTINAWIYMVHEWRPDMLEESSEMLREYSSKGSHGREYVSSENVKNASDLYPTGIKK